jgi:transposase
VPRKKRRSFTRAFKPSVVARTATAASIRGLAAELNIEQRMLYHWRDRFQTGGLQALGRLNELERKISQQQLELDFFARPCGMSGTNTGRSGGEVRDKSLIR